MAVPQFNGNAFTDSLNGMNKFFGGLQANRQALIQNQYLPQQLQLANQGQDIQNQTNQFNLSNFLPLSLKQKQLDYQNSEQLSPIEIALSQQKLQGAQNENALFPQKKTEADLKNQYIQSQIALEKYKASGGGGTANMRPGQPIIDPNTGQVIGYTPTTQALSQSQQQNAAREEANSLHDKIKEGLSPYQGLTGAGKLQLDLAAYKAGYASEGQIERLIKYQAAVGVVPTFLSAQGRAATGGVPSQQEINQMKIAYGYPEAGLAFGGLASNEFKKAQELIQQYQKNAGNSSINASTSPIVKQGDSSNPAQGVKVFDPKTGTFN